ncbi:MAG: HD domain-containing protein [Candidatus Aenigmatarchaeota archaeon]
MDLITFSQKVLELKKIKRTGWVSRGTKNPESVADHSFSLAILAYIFSKKYGLNIEKCIKMALVHDLCEIYSGDIPSKPFSDIKYEENKRKKEEEGLKKLLKFLPEEFREEIFSLWKEFEDAKTKEARLVKDLDKLEMCLQALDYAKSEYKKELSEFFEDGKNNIRTKEIREIFNKIYVQFKEVSKEKQHDI